MIPKPPNFTKYISEFWQYLFGAWTENDVNNLLIIICPLFIIFWTWWCIKTGKNSEYSY